MFNFHCDMLYMYDVVSYSHNAGFRGGRNEYCRSPSELESWKAMCNFFLGYPIGVASLSYHSSPDTPAVETSKKGQKFCCHRAKIKTLSVGLSTNCSDFDCAAAVSVHRAIAKEGGFN